MNHRRYLIRTLAFLVATVAAFALGLEMGTNIEQSRQMRDSAEVLVGMGCEETTSPNHVIIAREEDEFPWPCKEIERHRIALLD